MSAIITAHLIAAVIWVGGMFFAIYVLRLAAGAMEPPDRLALWGRAFQKFFPWVWMAIIILPLSGYYMVFEGYTGFGDLPIPYHIMHGLGLLMIALFLHMWFAPYARFKKALAAGEFPEAAKNLNIIRIIVTLNLWLGLINIAMGVSGRSWG
jgi:uncharacterized membrane protein